MQNFLFVVITILRVALGGHSGFSVQLVQGGHAANVGGRTVMKIAVVIAVLIAALAMIAACAPAPAPTPIEVPAPPQSGPALTTWMQTYPSHALDMLGKAGVNVAKWQANLNRTANLAMNEGCSGAKALYLCASAYYQIIRALSKGNPETFIAIQFGPCEQVSAMMQNTGNPVLWDLYVLCHGERMDLQQ